MKNFSDYHGMALEFASKELRGNEKIVLAAVLQDTDAYQYVGKTLRKDSEILRIVFGSYER